MRHIEKESRKFVWMISILLILSFVVINYIATSDWDDTSEKTKVHAIAQKYKKIIADKKIDDEEAKFIVEQREEDKVGISLLSSNSAGETIFSVVKEIAVGVKITPLQKQMYLNAVKLSEDEKIQGIKTEKLVTICALVLSNAFGLGMLFLTHYIYWDRKEEESKTNLKLVE
ncbi:hypothetical protein QK289_14240 [Exiguobacterium antarcticum]|uniref:Uncharacterized protein n=1 Tax=Exiguobacterium antarcticum TaxID=132920 RepID=A0ABT6R5T5_9BACL|nr:hypothetical protein [Exiguobacterium antarcticum]MDI3236170.1 hypothetical protein [Exiguobacterium antarcticum]